MILKIYILARTTQEDCSKFMRYSICLMGTQSPNSLFRDMHFFRKWSRLRSGNIRVQWYIDEGNVYDLSGENYVN